VPASFPDHHDGHAAENQAQADDGARSDHFTEHKPAGQRGNGGRHVEFRRDHRGRKMPQQPVHGGEGRKRVDKEQKKKRGNDRSGEILP
jgi:hypothetical protein